MNYFLFFLMLGFSFLSFGQLPKNLKYDALTYSYDSATVIITSGKKMAVYDQVNWRYLIPPTKSRLVNFPRSHQYAEIPLDGGPLCIYGFDGGNSFSVCGSDSTCSLAFMNPEMASYIVSANGLAYDAKSENYTGQKIAPELEWIGYEISKHQDFYFISDYQKEYYIAGYPGESRPVSAFAKSGVYSLSENKWVLEPVYESCHMLNDFVFCLRATEQKEFDAQENTVKKSYSYDIYEMTNEGMIPHNSLSTDLSTVVLAGMLQLDRVHATDSSSYCITEKDGKMGFIYFSLYEDTHFTKPAFEFNELLQPTADFVFYEPHYSKLAVVFRDSVSRVQIYHLNQQKQALMLLGSDADWALYEWFSGDPIPRESFFTASKSFDMLCDVPGEYYLEQKTEKMDYAYSGVGVSMINDSLINLLDYFQGNKLEAVKSVRYPDEDSLDSYNTALYKNRNEFARSGIYNLNAHSWLLEPIYMQIWAGSGKFLASDMDEVFSVFNQDGTLEISGLTLNDIYTNPEHLKIACEYKDIDEFFEAPNGYWHHTLLDQEVWPNRNKLFYVRSNDSLALYAPGWFFENTSTEDFYEFVHYQPDLDVLYYLEKDSIFLRSCMGNFSVPKKDGKFILNVSNLYSDPVSYELLKISGNDTVRYGELEAAYEALTTISLEIKNGVLIVNDHTSKVTGTYGGELFFESENSATWKKSDNGWTKISPYYATLEPVKNGCYIASTGFFNENYFGSETKDARMQEVPARYFLLDSNFNAIPFMDYFDFPHIEDLGFGIKIKLENGFYFFMTYDGVAVTDAAWHDFEIEKGKLKATLHTTYQLNQYGEQVLDEFGIPVELTSETVKYFMLP